MTCDHKNVVLIQMMQKGELIYETVPDLANNSAVNFVLNYFLPDDQKHTSR